MEKTIGFIVTAGHLDIEWYQPMASYRFWTAEALEDLRDAAAPRADFPCYVLDGQFFPLEIYLQAAPEAEPAMRRLIAENKLVIGPFYTQFDEWLPSAESIIRNCLYGLKHCKAFGGYMRAGYLPDNFGHPRQLPQILAGFGIDSLMFMRGLPEIPGDHPDEFLYTGLDGSQVLVSHFRESYAGAFDLFGKDIHPIQPREVPYYADYQGFEWHKELAVHDDPERIANSMVSNVRRIRERYPSGIVPLIAGYDHLPPQINIGDSVKLANAMQDDIEFVMGDVEQYVRRVQARLANPKVYDMELIGSKYQYVLLGALSTRGYLKRQNFACEALLERYAEPLDALAALQGYPGRPSLMDEAWRYMMINSAHDSIHGSSVDEVHVEMEARYGSVRQVAAGIIHDALKHLGKRLTPWKPLECVAYAPVAAPFPQPHEVWLPIGDREITMADAQGSPLPTQILPREPETLNGLGQPRNRPFPDGVLRKVVFMAQPKGYEIGRYAPAEGGSTADMPTTEHTHETGRYAPAEGDCAADMAATEHTHETGRNAPAEDNPAESPLAAGDEFIENHHVRVEVSGALIHVTDKATDRVFHNLNLIEEEADAGDAWDFSPPWIPGEVVRSSGAVFTSRLAECGSVRAVLEVSGQIDVPRALEGDGRSRERAALPVSFRITVYAQTPRVDVEMTIDNTAQDHRIRLRIPTGVRSGTVRSQGHLAVLDRAIERQKEIGRWLQPPTRLLPCREWVAVEDGTQGLAIAFKGLYDYEEVIDPLTGHPEVYLTLLRGIGRMGRINTIQRRGDASPSCHTPGAQCPGVHKIEWAYLPYTPCAADKAPFLPAAQAFLYPPVTHMIRSPRTGRLDTVPAPFAWDAPNIQFSAFKRAMDGDGYILRLYENQGGATALPLMLHGFSEARLSEMDERAGEAQAVVDGCVVLDFGPYKAVTVRLR